MNVPGPIGPIARPTTASSERSTERSSSTPAKPQALPGAALWDLLTAEEREFFAQRDALGPLSYRPGSNSGGGEKPNAPTGRRIDVRG